MAVSQRRARSLAAPPPSVRWSRQRTLEVGGLLVAVLTPLVFNPLDVNAFEPLKAAVFQIVTLLMLLAALLPPASALRSGGMARWPYLLYAGAILLATIFSVDVRRSLWTARTTADGALTLLSGVIFCWLLGQALTTRRQMTRLLGALVIGSVPVTVYGLLQAAGLDPLVWVSDSVSPVLSTVGRSNYLAAYLAMVMPFTLALWRSGDEGQPAHRFGLLFALQLVCLLLTLARAAWLGLLVGGLSAGLTLARRRPAGSARGGWLLRGLTAGLVGVALLVAMSASALLQPSAYGMRPPVYAQLRADSAAARLIFWRASLRLLDGRWLLGYGPGTFGAVVAAAQPAELTAAGPAAALLDDPHNLLLDRLLQTGVVGLAAYLAVLLAAARQWLRAWRRAVDRQALSILAAMLAALTAYLVQAQATPNVMAPDAVFWVILALAGAAPASLGNGHRQDDWPPAPISDS